MPCFYYLEKQHHAKQKGRGKKKMQVSRNLNGYTGPYPYSMLNDARHLLMRMTDIRDKAVWQRIRFKTGILNPNGDRDATLNGWGEASTYYSHADLFEENSIEGDCGLYDPRLASNPSTSAGPSATATSADMTIGGIELIFKNSSSSGTSSDNVDDVIDNRSNTKTNKEQKSDYKEKRKMDTPMKSALNKNTMKPSGSGNKTKSKNKCTTPEEGELIEINEDDSDEVIELLSDDNDVEITGQEKVIFDPIVTNDMVTLGQDVEMESSLWKPHIVIDIDSGKEDEDVMLIGSSETGNVPFMYDKVSSKRVSDSVSNTYDLKDDKTQIKKYVDKVPSVLDFPLVGVYKCDFCIQICETKSKMKEHLNSVCHFSASKIHVDQGNNTLEVIEKLAIMVKEHLYKKAVAICPHPMCKEIFTTIYTCSLHHKMKHDLFGGLVYGIASVESESEIINPIFSLACPVCQEKRYLQKKKRIDVNWSKQWTTWLIQHYETNNHYPFDYTKGDCHFVCPECREIFQDLHKAMLHEASHHSSAISHDTKLTVIQTGKIEVPELPERSEQTIINTKAVDSESVDSIPIESSIPSKSPAMSTPDTNLFFIDREPTSAYNPSESQPSVQEPQTNTAHCGHETGTSQPNTAYCGYGTGARKQTGIENPNGIALTVVSQPVKDDQDNLSIDTMEVKDEAIIEQNQFIKIKFLCDYCNRCDLNQDEIYQHLINECHSSASTIQVCDNNTPNFMVKPMSVLNYRAHYKQMVAACPSEGCCKIFADIFQCHIHCNLYHASFGHVYGVADIHKSVEVKLSVDAFCNTCKCSFENRNLLNKHLKDENHFPKDCKDLCPTMSMHFICIYCEKDFNTYASADNHIIQKHNMKEIKGNFTVRVIHRTKEVDTRNMLPFPFNRFGEAESLRNSWQSMGRLKKGMGKVSKKEIERRRKNLKEIGRSMKPKVYLNKEMLEPNRKVTQCKERAFSVSREKRPSIKKKKKKQKVTSNSTSL